MAGPCAPPLLAEDPPGHPLGQARPPLALPLCLQPQLLPKNAGSLSTWLGHVTKGLKSDPRLGSPLMLVSHGHKRVCRPAHCPGGRAFSQLSPDA